MDKKIILSTIADNVRNLMNQQSLSITELARICKISSGTISKIINSNMSITIPMAMILAQGLKVSLNEVLEGLTIEESAIKSIDSSKSEKLAIGILSINNRRMTSIQKADGKIIGQSELEGGLDLAETTTSLIHLIQESIAAAFGTDHNDISKELKYAKLNLVTQSYEFEDTRHKFVNFAKKYFKEVLLLSDWQITYLSVFLDSPGISLITDKGVSLSYMNHGMLKKLGGWKFPVYDLGGENWLGVEAIRHTIEAVEGYTPMTELAQKVMAKNNGKIEKITETCFKSANPDIYCIFADILLRSYLTGDVTAKLIIEKGFNAIHQMIELVDKILKKQLKITINGSLADIYKPFFKKSRLTPSASDADKATLLATITSKFLAEQGINLS